MCLHSCGATTAPGRLRAGPTHALGTRRGRSALGRPMADATLCTEITRAFCPQCRELSVLPSSGRCELCCAPRDRRFGWVQVETVLDYPMDARQEHHAFG